MKRKRWGRRRKIVSVGYCIIRNKFIQFQSFPARNDTFTILLQRFECLSPSFPECIIEDQAFRTANPIT